MAASSPVCLMSKATSTKSWLWHRRLSHLNFGTINDLTKHELVDGLPKLKYGKNHLCSACERGKSKKSSHLPKLVPSTPSKLVLLHIDLCGPMRVALINRKKYILMIVDDYPRFTWVYFLHTKDETLEIRKKFIAQVQLNYDGKIHKIQTDNGTKFKNATLKAHYEKLGIMQQFPIAHDLGKMKPKADIGIFIGYSKTSRGFRIYDWHNKKIMETIHVKFDELTAMAFEHDKYFEKKSSEMSINSSTQQVHNHEDSPSTSSIIIEEQKAPPIVTTSEEQTSLISLNEADEFY
ncbi:retrovirus-related pol polyprotein from transposon TNT 1-94 [Tanacetum coccineum]